jgi:hypothetical protein
MEDTNDITETTDAVLDDSTLDILLDDTLNDESLPSTDDSSGLDGGSADVPIDDTPDDVPTEEVSDVPSGGEFDVDQLAKDALDDVTDATNDFAISKINDIITRYRLSGSPAMLKGKHTWGIFDDILYKYWIDNIADDGQGGDAYLFKRWLNSDEFDDILKEDTWDKYVEEKGDLIISRLIDSRYIEDEEKVSFVDKKELDSNSTGDVSMSDEPDTTVFSDSFTDKDENVMDLF